jgi:hypothetical protein
LVVSLSLREPVFHGSFHLDATTSHPRPKDACYQRPSYCCTAGEYADPVRATSGRVVAIPNSSLRGTAGVGDLHQFGRDRGGRGVARKPVPRLPERAAEPDARWQPLANFVLMHELDEMQLCVGRCAPPDDSFRDGAIHSCNGLLRLMLSDCRATYLSHHHQSAWARRQSA